MRCTMPLALLKLYDIRGIGRIVLTEFVAHAKLWRFRGFGPAVQQALNVPSPSACKFCRNCFFALELQGSE